MLPLLSRFRPLRRAFLRPLRLLRHHWLVVAVGTALVPVHAAVMLC